MPLVRFKVRNEFGLGRPELYGNGTVEDEDPKAVLGGVTVAGLVGILRQLGDLAEFAAEVFHGIQEQVTVTASRSQKLTSRVRRIESALSPLEKAVLSQTSHIHFAYTAGCEWHPRIKNEQNHFIYNDLPLFVMESYEQCRDPPRLHLLDKFDVGGPGSCLRRYSDPTFFRKELSDPVVANDIKVQRDKSHRKSKRKRLSQRKIPRSHLVSTSEETSGTHPSSLTDDRHTTSQSTSTVGMACVSNMQELSDVLGQPHLREQSNAQEQSKVQEPSKTHDSRNDSGYIEYLIHPMSEPKEKLSEGFLPSSPQHADSICSALAEGCTDVIDDNIEYSPSGEQPVPCAPSDTWDEKKETPESLFEQNIEDEEASEILESKFGPGTPDKETQNQRGFDRMDILFNEVDTVKQVPCRRQLSNIDTIPQCESEGENQSERESETESRSEADEYVDARNTIESESDNDLDGQPKQNLERYLGDVDTHCSEDNSKDNSADMSYGHMAQDPEHDHSGDESCSVSYLYEDEEAFCSLSVPVPEETVSRDKNFQEPGESVGTFCPSLAETVPARKILREELVASYLLSGETFPDERISPEESVAMYLSPAEAVPHKKISPKELVAKHSLLAEAFPDKSPEEPVAMDHSLAKAILQEEHTAMYPLSAEAFLDERISPEESIDMSPSLAEAVPHKKISPEEPVAMYPLLAEAFADESLEEPVATDHSLAKAIPQELISREEPIATYPLSAEAFLDERISPEESIAMCPSLAEVVPLKQISPEEPVAMYPFLAEAFADESPEEPVATNPPFAKVVSHEKFAVEEPVLTYPLSAEAVPDESISPEEPTTYPPLAEAVPLKTISPEEPVAMNPFLAEAFADESPEEPIATDPPLAKVVSHEKFSVEEPVLTYPLSAEAVPDESISPEEPTTYTPLAEAVPSKKALPDESVTMDPLSAEAIPDERISPEEPVAMDLSLAKAIPHEKISPEEPVATYSSSAEVVSNLKNSSEVPDATYPSLAEAVPDGKILPEAPDATCCQDGDHATDEPHTASDVLTNKNSSEESDATYPSLAEAVPDGKILLEAPDATCCPDEDHATDEPHTASDVLTNKTICESESTERTPDKTIHQVPRYDLAVFDPRASCDVDNNLKGEPLAPFCSPSISGNMVLDANYPLRGGAVKSCPDARESLSNDVCVESVTIWSNGSLLGLEPSKPPVFAVPNSVNGDIQNQNNGEVSLKASREKEPSDEPVESNDKASDPSSQHSDGVSYSIGSHQQSTAISFGVFGLSHRLLMNGFRRNLSACNYESLPASSNTEVAMEDETEHGYQETCGSTFNEPLGSESLFDSPTSSPPLEHMKISFIPIDGFAVSKLKLKIPSQPQYHEREADMFPLFQLVPETASPHDNASDSDDDNDTFCRSSPCISVSCCSKDSVSDSELWESDGNPERMDGNIYDALLRISPGDSISSFEQVGDKNTFAGIGMEPSLSGSFLDIPCFDAVDASHATREIHNVSNANIHDKLPSHIESTSSKLLGSLEQDNIPEPESCGSGDRPHALADSPEHASSPKTPELTSFTELPVDTTANGKQLTVEAAASTSEAKQSDPRRNSIAVSPPT